MKQDRTHYQCDRCKKSVTVPLGEPPDGFWWHLQIDTLRRFKHAVMGGDEGREVFLCRECAIDLDRWLRNDPKMTIVRESEGVGLPIAAPTEPPPVPVEADLDWLERGERGS